MSLLIKPSAQGFFFDCFPGIDGVQWWTASLNQSGHNTTTTNTAARDSFCFSLWLSTSLFCGLSRSRFCSLSHTHNHAVQMNAHTNVTDCETVTHTQQQRSEKRTHSFLSPSEVWRFLLGSFSLRTSERGERVFNLMSKVDD